MTNNILKYIHGTASVLEKKEVEDWINSSKENTQKFHQIKAQYIISSFEETEKSINLKKELSHFKKNLNRRHTQFWRTSLKHAAVIISFLVSAIYLAHTSGIFESAPVTPLITENSVTIKLNNGNIRVLNDNENIQVTDSKGNNIGVQSGNQIHYKNNITSQKLVYNTLTVPYGKHFDIILSDETRVYLNAGSSLRYPVNFIKGQTRKVFLNGEAFFDVSKDTQNPFVVTIDDLKIRVLGTKFNVSAYPEDLATKTALVEGSVALYQEKTYQPKKATLLKPGHLASLNKKKKNISLEEVDLSIYTSWIKGNILFRHEPFKNIIKKLERQFDVTIVNNDTTLNEVLFTASFNNADLEYILETFHKNFGINYTLNQKQIIINS
jgi:ferric-dicitrate binding protein FerR (iron transport regulator)